MHVYVLTEYFLKYADQGPPGSPVLKVKNPPFSPKFPKIPVVKRLHFCIFKYIGLVLALYVYLSTYVCCVFIVNNGK